MIDTGASDASFRGEDELRCDGCGNTLRIPTVPTAAKDENACHKCSTFEALQERVWKTDEAWRAVESRRVNLRGRIESLKEHNEARKELANFLLQVPHHRQADRQPPILQPSPSVHQCAVPPTRLVLPSGILKRSRSEASLPIPTQASLPKRPRVIRGKRVSFEAATIFRDETDQRELDKYHRRADSYTPGRNAASEGSHLLDTSGQALEFKDFYQQKWDRKHRSWMSIPSDNQADSQEQAILDRANETEVGEENLVEASVQGVDETETGGIHCGQDAENQQHSKASDTPSGQMPLTCDDSSEIQSDSREAISDSGTKRGDENADLSKTAGTWSNVVPVLDRADTPSSVASPMAGETVSSSEGGKVAQGLAALHNTAVQSKALLDDRDIGKGAESGTSVAAPTFSTG